MNTPSFSLHRISPDLVDIRTAIPLNGSFIPFDIYVHGVKAMLGQQLQGPFTHIPVRDIAIVIARISCQIEEIQGIFQKKGRLIKGNAASMAVISFHQLHEF